MLPEFGRSKPATILSIVVLPQPEGPSRETNSPCSMERSKSFTTRVVPKDFSRWERSRKPMRYCFACVCLEKRVKSWISPMQPQVMRKAITASAEGS